MPTPERIKAASLEKRMRACVVCRAVFFVPTADRIGRTCSKPCGSIHMRNVKTGTKQSAETKAKRAVSIKASWAQPEIRERRLSAHSVAVRKWHADPENAEAFAARSSERMKRRHADPDWQKVRDQRSSATMTANWEKHRELYVAQAGERYLRNLGRGEGICSPESRRKKAIAAKWILKKAQEALHAETDYNATYAEVQARLRRELPYDGPQNDSDYMEYLQKLGRAVVNSPECRTIADTFLSEAIPRFAAEWRAR